MAAVAAGDAEMPEVGADGGGAGGAVDGAGGDPEPKESAAEAQERFEVELEFVQCLANPKYLMYLAQQGFLADDKFIDYIKYLQYWRAPDYVAFIRYPHCLYFLERLLDPTFREEVKQPGFVEILHQQQYHHWAHYKANRAKEAAALDGTATKATAVAVAAAADA